MKNVILIKAPQNHVNKDLSKVR